MQQSEIKIRLSSWTACCICSLGMILTANASVHAKLLTINADLIASQEERPLNELIKRLLPELAETSEEKTTAALAKIRLEFRNTSPENFQHKKLAEKLADLLERGGSKTRREAAELLLWVNGVRRDRLVPLLLRCINDDDRELRVNLIRLLRRNAGAAESAVPLLRQNLKDFDPRVRQACCSALSSIGRPAAYAAKQDLLDLLKSGVANDRVQAAIALSWICPEDVDVIPVLVSDYPAVKKNFDWSTWGHITAIGNIGPTSDSDGVIEVLRDTIHNSDKLSQTSSLVAIRRIGPASLPLQQDILRCRNAGNANFVDAALKEIEPVDAKSLIAALSRGDRIETLLDCRSFSVDDPAIADVTAALLKTVAAANADEGLQIIPALEHCRITGKNLSALRSVLKKKDIADLFGRRLMNCVGRADSLSEEDVRFCFENLTEFAFAYSIIFTALQRPKWTQAAATELRQRMQYTDAKLAREIRGGLAERGLLSKLEQQAFLQEVQSLSLMYASDVLNSWKWLKAAGANSLADYPSVEFLCHDKNEEIRLQAEILRVHFQPQSPTPTFDVCKTRAKDPFCKEKKRSESIKMLGSCKLFATQVALLLADIVEEPVFSFDFERDSNVEHYQAKWSAATSLGQMGMEAAAAAPALVRELIRTDLDNDDIYLQSMLMESLAAIGPAAVPEVVKMTQHPIGKCRRRAALLLQKMGSDAKPAVPMLQKMLNDPLTANRDAARTAIAVIESQARIPSVRIR